MDIIDKAFSGQWISGSELKTFAEEYQKEFAYRSGGLISGDVNINQATDKYSRIKRTAIGGIGGVGGAIVGQFIGDAIGAKLAGVVGKGKLSRGVTIGAGVAGALAGAISDYYMVIFLNDAGIPDYLIVDAIGEPMAIWFVKKANRRGLRFEAFKFPEEIRDINKYIKELTIFVNRVKKSSFRPFQFPERIDQLKKLERVSLVQ